MNDKRDMAPMVWSDIKSRETARRMDAYAGEITSMHPHFSFDSPARAKDMDLTSYNECVCWTKPSFRRYSAWFLG